MRRIALQYLSLYIGFLGWFLAITWLIFHGYGKTALGLVIAPNLICLGIWFWIFIQYDRAEKRGDKSETDACDYAFSRGFRLW